MIKCYDCGKFNFESQTYYDYLSEENRKIVYEGCPDCESPDIHKIDDSDEYFFGECPYCDKIIADVWEVIKTEEFDCECKDCKKKYHIINCEIDYEEDI